MTNSLPAIRRRFVHTSAGPIHIATAGAGLPILLLHQTPRSWDEFRDVLPLLGQRYQAIAMDTAGFGDSCKLPLAEHSIERWSQIAFEVLDALDLPRAVVCGHHTGAVTALEMAASQPQRVTALVLSSCPMNDAQRRAAHAGKRTIDEVEPRADGTHLGELWSRRQPFYPDGDIDLMQRFMVDAIKAGEMAAHGHVVVRNYVMEQRIGKVTAPTLVLKAGSDPHSAPYAERVAAAIAGSTLATIEHGMVPMPDQLPQAFSGLVMGFLDNRAPS
ncbi:alpha/beta fold hydrolase [Herbaspirillum sp. YR522]|uniref:alpha/beta fold hydrolase n=1 Tax=Herbaspirillum sp. YR522 TaxID=1144342 RepID=UPI00026FAB2C|nr:alpha/beta fold hydrolase [Herbaspirillum sp. YR522]EJN02834.1 putative hydrolase or acyltransferase of alpha/beta superfamily [Herbaspirillum sp. YR522]